MNILITGASGFLEVTFLIWHKFSWEKRTPTISFNQTIHLKINRHFRWHLANKPIDIARNSAMWQAHEFAVILKYCIFFIYHGSVLRLQRLFLTRNDVWFFWKIYLCDLCVLCGELKKIMCVPNAFINSCSIANYCNF